MLASWAPPIKTVDLVLAAALCGTGRASSVAAPRLGVWPVVGTSDGYPSVCWRRAPTLQTVLVPQGGGHWRGGLALPPGAACVGVPRGEVKEAEEAAAVDSWLHDGSGARG